LFSFLGDDTIFTVGEGGCSQTVQRKKMFCTSTWNN